jgi:integrase
MPGLIHQVPSYRLHRASGQAVVNLGGRDIYLGQHGTRESQTRYEQLVAQWLASHRHLSAPGGPEPSNARNFTINELFVVYWDFAKSYYVKNGRPTGEQANLRDAARLLTQLFGTVPVADFGPAALKAVRQKMLELDLCRRVINGRVNRIRRMFKWGVENQLVGPLVLQALQAVAPLKRGRCDARETEPVKPVPQARIDAVLQHVPSQVAAMIRLQLLTGMRPGEVVIMRGCDLDTTGKLWVYRPSCHKTEHHGKERTVYLGPMAQDIVKKHLKADLSAYLFSPRHAMAERYAVRNTHRRTPCPKPRTQRRLSNHYTTTSYARAITYACDKAFSPPVELATTPLDQTARQVADHLAKLCQWRRDHHWHPNQLRHNAATSLRKQYGLDAARAILGHSSPVVTEVYAELDQAKAMQIMAEVG